MRGHWLRWVCLVALVASVSGCVVRPLGWYGHGGHGYRDRGEHHSERIYRDEGHRNDGRRP